MLSTRSICSRYFAWTTPAGGGFCGNPWFTNPGHTVDLLRSDWLLALPVGAAVCGSLLLPELLRARGAGNTVVALVSAAVIAAVVLVSRMLGFEGTQLIPVGFVTVVLACGCHLVFRYRRAN